MSVDKANKLRITREWRQKNLEHTSAKNKEYKAAHHERELARSRAYSRSPAGRWRSGKSSAQTTGREWSITEAQHADLLSKPCFYCKGPLSPTGSGLDRMDNNGGYTLENVISCCRSCNSGKGKWFSHEEFTIMMAALINWRIKR